MFLHIQTAETDDVLGSMGFDCVVIREFYQWQQTEACY